MSASIKYIKNQENPALVQCTKKAKLQQKKNNCRASGVGRASGVPHGLGLGFSLVCGGRNLQPTVRIAWEK
jgi:hypothetical protein